jgi:hypothetical protein
MRKLYNIFSGAAAASLVACSAPQYETLSEAQVNAMPAKSTTAIYVTGMIDREVPEASPAACLARLKQVQGTASKTYPLQCKQAGKTIFRVNPTNGEIAAPKAAP